MIQAVLVITTPSIVFAVSTVLFHKYLGANVYVPNCMLHFYMFAPTKATVELANGNTGHTQGVRIILCSFTNCTIICPAGPIYYFTRHPYNTISLCFIKFYPVNKTKEIWKYMEALSLHTGAPTIHWKDNPSFITVVEYKRVTLRVKPLTLLSIFYKKILTMVFLFQNTRNLVLFRQICEPKYVKVQLLVWVINGWMGSYSIRPVIHNITNSWYYMICFWTKRIMWYV